MHLTRTCDSCWFLGRVYHRTNSPGTEIQGSIGKAECFQGHPAPNPCSFGVVILLLHYDDRIYVEQRMLCCG